MKRLIPTALTALFVMLGLLGDRPASAQTRDADAARVAAQVQTFYDQTSTVMTAFSQVYYDRMYQRRTRARGILSIERPGRLRFDYLGGDGKVIVSDGRQITLYEPGDDEGDRGQYATAPVREEGLPSALGFLTGQARLDRDFTFRLRDARQFSWDGHVLELRPRGDEPAYRRVFLYIDDDPRTAGVVQRVLIQDHEGNLNHFVFTRMRFNRTLDSSRFEFRPPPGARRLTTFAG